MELVRGKKPLNKSLLKTGCSVPDICKTLGIGRTTFYRYVKPGENGE
jgi:predicted DNA-binding transcriptional regulator AlpA